MKSTKSWLAAALVAAFVLGGARVGNGLEYNKKTDPHEITLKLYFHPGSLEHEQNRDNLSRLTDWKGFFQSAADTVWYYTSNQVAIKEVQVYRRSKPLWGCDVEVKNEPGCNADGKTTHSWPHSGVYNYNLNSRLFGTSITLPYDLDSTTVKPKAGRCIAHEMGHSIFGCVDEYKLVCMRGYNNSAISLGWTWVFSFDKQDFFWWPLKEDVYGISPDFTDIADNQTQPLNTSLHITGDVADAFSVAKKKLIGPHTIMNHDQIWTEMSTPTKGNPPWDGAMHYPSWTGGLSVGSKSYSDVYFATYQEYEFQQSCWERMVDTRGLKLGVRGSGAKPEMNWRLMDGPPVALLVVDSSGSMSGTKWNNALSAAKRAVGMAWLAKEGWEGDFVGAIKFASSPTTLFEPVEMKDKATRSAKQSAISGNASGGTRINAALQKALIDLKGVNTNAMGPESIILLSDGQSGDTVTDTTLNTFKERGVRVNTVAYGSDADTGLLRRIANATGGKMGSIMPIRGTRQSVGTQSRSLMSTLNLSKFFADLYSEGRESEQSAQLEGVASGTPVEQEIVVDTFGDIDLTVNLYWERGDMDVALVKPDGTVIERAAAEAAKADLDGGKETDSAFIRVNNPEPGTWKVRVTPAAGSGEQAYLATVSCTGRDNMRLYAQTSGDSLTWPAPLVVSASFGGAVPAIMGAVVTAVVTCPDGTEVPFELNDNGENGDEEAGDGVYAAEFKDFTEDGEYRFDVEGKNVSGKTSWRGYSPSLGGELPEPEQVEPFVRRKSLTVQYDGLPEFINATRYTETEFASWTLNRNTGAMTGSLVVSNQPTSRKTLIAPFWYAVTETVNVTLAKVDGYTDDGDPYVNITDKVEAALMAKYGRTSMAPGEWVTIDGVEVYSRDRSIPNMTALWSLWADPPAGAERRIDSYDRNANGVLDDEEILLAVEHWEALDMDDEALLKRIALWKQGEE